MGRATPVRTSVVFWTTWEGGLGFRVQGLGFRGDLLTNSFATGLLVTSRSSCLKANNYLPPNMRHEIIDLQCVGDLSVDGAPQRLSGFGLQIRAALAPKASSPVNL